MKKQMKDLLLLKKSMTSHVPKELPYYRGFAGAMKPSFSVIIYPTPRLFPEMSRFDELDQERGRSVFVTQFTMERVHACQKNVQAESVCCGQRPQRQAETQHACPVYVFGSR